MWTHCSERALSTPQKMQAMMTLVRVDAFTGPGSQCWRLALPAGTTGAILQTDHKAIVMSVVPAHTAAHIQTHKRTRGTHQRAHSNKQTNTETLTHTHTTPRHRHPHHATVNTVTTCTSYAVQLRAPHSPRNGPHCGDVRDGYR